MKVHNINDIRPYYSNIHSLMLFMNNIKIDENTYFHEDSWPLVKGRNTNFRLSENLKEDILQKKEYKILKFFWKFTVYLYLNRLTHVQPKRTGKRHTFRSSSLLIKFLAENKFLYISDNNFIDVAYIKKDFFNEFIKYLNKHEYEKVEKNKKFMSPLKNSSKASYLQPLVHWFDIGTYLPLFFKLKSDPLSGKSPENIFPQDEDRTPWCPLEEKEALFILKNAVNYIKNNKDGILVLFDAVMKRKYSNDIDELDPVKSRKLKLYEIELIFDIIKNQDLKFSKDCPLFTRHKLIKESIKKGSFELDQTNLFYKSVLFNSVRLLVSSCIIVILFTTGMRRREFFSLKKGCLKTADNTEIAYLDVTIEKTEYDEDGRLTSIPIPPFLVDVVRTFEKIGDISNESEIQLFFNYFAESVPGSKENHYSEQLIYLYLRRFSSHFGIEKSPRPHEFRKTLAWYMMTKTSYAAILLKELFSHSSYAMVLEYMHTGPLLRRELDELTNQYNEQIADELAIFSSTGKLSGAKGDRIINSLNKPRFKGLTNTELQITTKQFILKQINDKNNLIFITKLSYCVRTASSLEESPCMKRNDMNKRINLTPNPENCNSLICKDAIFTPLNLINLKKEKQKYTKIIEVSNIINDNDKNRIFILNAEKQINRIDEVIQKLED